LVGGGEGGRRGREEVVAKAHEILASLLRSSHSWARSTNPGSIV
jgi:hypothetical protein